MKTKTVYIFLVLVLLQAACAGCPGAHETGIDEASGVRVEVDYYGNASASTSNVCYLHESQVTLIAPSGKTYEAKPVNSSYPPLSSSDGAEVVALFPDLASIQMSATTVVFLRAESQWYRTEDGPSSSGSVDLEVYEGNMLGEQLGTKTITTYKD